MIIYYVLYSVRYPEIGTPQARFIYIKFLFRKSVTVTQPSSAQPHFNMADYLSRPYRAQPAIQAFEIPAKTYISQRAGLYGIVSAAIIIHNNRVLLIQRASTDEHPNLWEVPGGSANQDETIVQCAVRELREETGLHASEVSRLVGGFDWVDRQGSAQRDWMAFIFLVKVDSANDIRLDPEEHQAYLWATEGEVQAEACGNTALEWISRNQRHAILGAFDLVRAASG